MYSKVKLAGHPLHPMLVGFPITLYVAALIGYLVSMLGGDPFWFRVAVYANVAGVVMAVVASLPGFVDWAFGIPSGTPAKATGALHMLFNVLTLLAFALDAWLQWDQRAGNQPASALAVTLAALGVAFMLVAGFLGWKLVQTHHVGVDLTLEQERLEPRATPRRGGDMPLAGAGHGRHAA